MSKSGQDIPEAELEVLGALWQLGEATVRAVMDLLGSRKRRLAYNTVLTLLGRLEKRGYAVCNRKGTANVYRARIRRETVTAERVKRLAQNLGEETTVPLILELVEASKMSASDIRDVRELLARLEAEGGSD